MPDDKEQARHDGYLHARAEADERRRAFEEEIQERADEVSEKLSEMLPPGLDTHYSIEDILP
jgi:molecular chaperone GrpE (heat shock protein)